MWTPKDPIIKEDGAVKEVVGSFRCPEVKDSSEFKSRFIEALYNGKYELIMHAKAAGPQNLGSCGFP